MYLLFCYSCKNMNLPTYSFNYKSRLIINNIQKKNIKRNKKKWRRRRSRNSTDYRERRRKCKIGEETKLIVHLGNQEFRREPEGNRKSDPAGRRNSRNPLVAKRIGGIAKGTERRSSTGLCKRRDRRPGTFFQAAEPRFTKADVSFADREIPLVALRWRCRAISTSDDLPN